MDSTSPVGRCKTMCPPKEKIIRERNGLLSKYELPPRCPIKSFSRSAAGQNMSDPENLRPGPILQETTNYLINLFVSQFYSSQLDIYEFVSDRFRAVRQDATIQRLSGAVYIDILKPMVKFYVFSGYLLNKDPKFQNFLNDQQLRDCLDILLKLDFEGSSEIMDANILLKLNVTNIRDFNKFENRSKSREVWEAWFEKNYCRAFRIAEELPIFLRICFSKSFPIIRSYALKALATGYNSSSCRYPLANLQRILQYDWLVDLQDDLQKMGIKHDEMFVSFRKMDLLSNTELTPTKWSAIDRELNLSEFFS